MYLRVLSVALLLMIASSAFAAYGRPHWSYLEFGEDTQVGTVRIKIATDSKKTPVQITKLEIHINGRRLKMPRKVETFAKDPHLDGVSLWRLASIVCVSDEDCRRVYPVELHVPYGPRISREPEDSDKCETSQLYIYFFGRELQSASYYECTEADDGRSIDLYERPD